MYVADVLKIAEQRCVTLEEESRSLREAKKEADERLKYVRKQKQIVEGENERLRAQLTGGRPTNAISIETAQRQSDKGKNKSYTVLRGSKARGFPKKTGNWALQPRRTVGGALQTFGP